MSMLVMVFDYMDAVGSPRPSSWSNLLDEAGPTMGLPLETLA